MRRAIGSTWTLGLAVALGACTPGPELSPAPAADYAALAPGQGATAVEAGVGVTASVEAWDAAPPRLESEVTPVLVRISNGSAVPLRIRYNEFQLVAPEQTFAAIPPFAMEGEVSTPVIAPFYPASEFEVAPYLSPYYPDLTPFTGPWEPDPIYYETYFPTFLEFELPTPDMLQRALPEGVLEPGGTMQGFLYFQRVGDDVPGVAFEAELVNALTGATFGTVSIPFVEMDQ